jgi:hypothetical protein
MHLLCMLLPLLLPVTACFPCSSRASTARASVALLLPASSWALAAPAAAATDSRILLRLLLLAAAQASISIQQ